MQMKSGTANNSISTEEKEALRSLIRESGAIAVGFASAGLLDEEESSRFRQWIGRDMHAGMSYMERHAKLREDLGNVLPSTKSVIAIAFSYVPDRKRAPGLPSISRYAYGEDYHDVLRRRLKPVMEELTRGYPQEKFRLCVDSAPVAERYWALRAGIGRRGINGTVIVDGAGCYAFLCEILTTAAIEPDAPSTKECLRCGACLRSCPTGALTREGIDCSRCLSYLTIEHKGDWNPEMVKTVRDSVCDILFGCDRCLSVCPHNRRAEPTEIAEFRLKDEIAALDRERILESSDEEIRRLIAGTALNRAKPEGLRRNCGGRGSETKI